MTDDLRLFDCYTNQAGAAFRYHALARTDDPATSHAAAASVRLRTGSQKWRLLEAFFAGGPAIAEQAARRANLLHAGYWKRVSELLADGLIYDTGVTLVSTAGEACRVYRITADGCTAVASSKGRP